MPPRKRGGKITRGRASKSAAKSNSPISAAFPEVEPKETSAAADAAVAASPDAIEAAKPSEDLPADADVAEPSKPSEYSTAVADMAEQSKPPEDASAAADVAEPSKPPEDAPSATDVAEPTKLPEDALAAADVPELMKLSKELPGAADVATKSFKEPAAAADRAEAVEVNEPGKLTEEPPAAANESALPSEEPPVTAYAAEGPADSSMPKTVTKVKKVVKKKIIVKKVPKGSASSASTMQESESHPQLNPTEQADESAGVTVQMDEDKADVLLEYKSDDKNAHPVDEIATVVAQVGEGKDSSLLEKKEDSVAPIEEEKEYTTQMEEEKPGAVEEDEKGMLERRRRRKTEIFIGGLDRDVTEEDIRKVFAAAGEIVEVRMIIDSKTGKNKGYAFCRYADPEQAKQAVNDFKKVEIRGKQCGAAALEGNDTIFLGNIDKTWKKDDVMKFLKEIGIEKIDALTVMADPNNAELNRGFAFLELETYRDAQIAHRNLQMNAFSMGRKIKVAWAEQLNDQEEEEIQKVKSVYAEGFPSSWDERKLRECFKKYGEIEDLVFSRSTKSAKRKDYAFINFTTRDAAVSCVESFNKEELTENGSKVDMKVSLAKPVQKGKQIIGGSRPTFKADKRKPVQRQPKHNVPPIKGKFSRSSNAFIYGESFTANHHMLHSREPVAWKQGHMGYSQGPAVHDYTHPYYGGKRTFSSQREDAYPDTRGYPRARMDSSYPVAGTSYDPSPYDTAGPSMTYYQRPPSGYQSGEYYGGQSASDYRLNTYQPRQGGAPYGSGFYPRY